MKKIYFSIFDQLPPGYRERAKLRFEQDPRFHIGYPAPNCLYEAVNYGFSWAGTKEGGMWWMEIGDWKGGELPELKNHETL